MTGLAERLIALEPATYVSPAQRHAKGAQAPRIPFPIYLVEHERGLVLFDAGLDPDHVGAPENAYGELAERLEMDFREEHLIEHGLREHGLDIADVQDVVASHLHFDHAGGLKRFPHATVHVGAEERAYAHAPEAYCRAWFREADFGDHLGLRWREIPADDDLFGDGAVTILWMPGHTPGSLAMMVRLPTRTIILSGDVVHTRDALEREMAYPLDVDTVAARRSLRKLRFLEQRHDAQTWIAHDPDDWAAFQGSGVKR